MSFINAALALEKKLNSTSMRIPGYYWIRIDETWMIAEYTRNGIFHASSKQIKEKDISEIDENEIRRSWHILMPVNYKDCDNISLSINNENKQH